MARSEEEVVIKASPDAIYDLLADSNNLQKLLPGFDTKVLETGEDYKICQCQLKIDKKTYRWQHRENFDDELLSIDYSLLSGDWQHLHAWWKIIPAEDECELIFQIETVPKIKGLMTYLTWPFFKRKMNKFCLSALQAVKDRMELSYGESD